MKKKVTYKKMAELLREKFGCEVGAGSWYGGQVVLWMTEGSWTEEMIEFMENYCTVRGNGFVRVG